jgi:hypothetical protein
MALGTPGGKGEEETTLDSAIKETEGSYGVSLDARNALKTHQSEIRCVNVRGNLLRLA